MGRNSLSSGLILQLTWGTRGQHAIPNFQRVKTPSKTCLFRLPKTPLPRALLIQPWPINLFIVYVNYRLTWPTKLDTYLH